MAIEVLIFYMYVRSTHENGNALYGLKTKVKMSKGAYNIGPAIGFPFFSGLNFMRRRKRVCLPRAIFSACVSRTRPAALCVRLPVY